MQSQPDDYRLFQGAWVHLRAQLPEDPSEIHLEPGALIGADVELGPGTWVGAGAVIYGPTRMGVKNQIHPKAVIGGAPQDLSYAGQPTRLEVGDRNVFREGVTISRASTKGSGVTRIGNDNFFMAYSHVGHDSIVENRVVLANGVLIAGHCRIESNVNLAGGCAIVQFCTIGRFAFVCGTAGVRKDLEPFISHDIRTGLHHEPQPTCINEVGLKRAGASPETIQKLRSAYKVLFLQDGFLSSPEAARKELERRAAICPETEELLGFIERKRQGKYGRALGR